MKKKEQTFLLNRLGVDEASLAILSWLQKTKLNHKDILRIRITMEDLLTSICEHGEGKVLAKIALIKVFGTWLLRVRYDGARYNPLKPADNEVEEFTSSLLTATGYLPTWRFRTGKNILVLRIAGGGAGPEVIMLGCIVSAMAVGLLGSFIPEAARTAVSDFGLSYLSGSFLNLLNTFIGPMIFLTVITGICGIGNAAALGKIGKQMMSRFILISFAMGVIITFTARFFFPLGQGSTGGSSQFKAILDMIFGIIPANPVKPFLEGNTLQIVFMAVMTGVILLLTGSQTESLRSILSQAQLVIMRCVTVVCVFLPVYIFSSLVKELWASGSGLLIRLWKPLAVCAGLNAVLAAAYIAFACWKLKVKPSVLLPKLMPDFIIGLSTASSSAAFATGMEINEKKLGIDPAFSRMAHPIGGLLFAANLSMVYVIAGAFAADFYGVHADIAWWITLWIACTLLAIATPPVAGGTISCLSVMMIQMHIPSEGLAIGVALAMFMDFLCTGTRILILHLELALQADHMNMLNHEVLRNS